MKFHHLSVIDTNIMGGSMTEDWVAVWSHLTRGPSSYSEIIWRVIFR